MQKRVKLKCRSVVSVSHLQVIRLMKDPIKESDHRQHLVEVIDSAV